MRAVDNVCVEKRCVGRSPDVEAWDEEDASGALLGCPPNTVSGSNSVQGCGNTVSGIGNMVYGNFNVVSGVNNRVCGDHHVVSGVGGNYGCF